MTVDRFKAAAIVLAAISLMPAIAMSKEAKIIDVPVTITADGNDACANGEIVGLDPKGDGFLSVRSGPGGQPYKEVDRLYNGNQIYICGYKDNWHSVVYSADRGIGAECGVSKAWPTSRAYTGPCRYGWVHRRYVKVIAE